MENKVNNCYNGLLGNIKTQLGVILGLYTGYIGIMENQMENDMETWEYIRVYWAC